MVYKFNPFTNNLDDAGVSGSSFVSQSSGTFTPTLLFGGANTGMTGTFTGSYVKTGLQVDVSISITLTAKGSSTGSATVGTLPFAVSATQPAKWIPMYPQNCTATGSTYTSFAGLSNVSASTISLFNFSQGNSAAIQFADTNFTNTSVIILTGTYWASS